MKIEYATANFAAMGARLKLREVPAPAIHWRRPATAPRDYSIDIQRDNRGQYFEIRVPVEIRDSVEFTVLQNQPRDRHLLLLARTLTGNSHNDRFLCGHDEREWFVAAVPGGASSVRQAMDALQPPAVRDAIARSHVSSNKRYERKNRAFRRQGEWFFVPEPKFVVDEKFVLHNEPLRRGSGKPHMVELLFRSGGETVYVCAKHPNGVPEQDYRTILAHNAKANRWGWRVMRRNPGVYARGAVRHADHETITLPFWHRVVMNTETQTRAMANVAFLD